MRYSFISAAILALTSSVFAQTEGFDVITSPIKDQRVPAGEPFEIVWQPGTYTKGTATITLLQGATPETLQDGQVVVAGVKNSLGKYKWDVPADIPAFETYGFRITLDDDKTTAEDETKIFQYSFPFHITGTKGGNSTTPVSGTTTVHLGTGTAYTPKPTANSTIITTTSNTSSVTPTPKPSSNYTLTTGVTTVRATPSTSAPSSTGSAPAQQTTNAAMANAVSGSLALIGGVVLAFAL